MGKEYWQKRFIDEKERQIDFAEAFVKSVEKQYIRAISELKVKVKAWYIDYADSNGVSLVEAKKRLNSKERKELLMRLDEYQELAKIDPNHIKIVNASIATRLTRLESLLYELSMHADKLAIHMDIDLRDTLQELYEDAYYKNAYLYQQAHGNFRTMQALPKQVIEEIIKQPWANDGKMFSERIWDNRERLVHTLYTNILQSLILQEGQTKLAERMAREFGTNFKQMKRLIDTEMAYFHERANLESLKDVGCEKVEILATLDTKTSEICQRMDGTLVDIKDAQAGVTIPPFHCHCRSTSIPWYEGLATGKRVMRDAKTRRSMNIDGDITYQTWYNKYVKSTELNGVVASNGIKITEMSLHQQKRADERNLDMEGIRDALERPLDIGDVRIKNGVKSQRFIGRTTTVNVNPDTGVIITSWRTGKSILRKLREGKT